MITIHKPALLAAALSAALTCACKVGPKYVPPPAPVSVVYKEKPPAGWKEAQPGDATLKGKWWELYNDPELNALVEQVSISNENVLVAEANFRQAKAAVRVARSELFPLVTATTAATAARFASSTSVTDVQTSNFVGNVSTSPGVRTNYRVPIDATYEADLFGRIRRTVTQSVNTAQASAADLENVRLLFQSELAQNYFQLRTIDTQIDLLTRTAASFKSFLELTRVRFKAGVISDLDVAQAETQLYNVEAQKIDQYVQRTALEHAIAVLIGKPPADISIPFATTSQTPPPVPTGVPSELLERRPDIATAERNVAAANEQIGIAKAAYYPTFILTGNIGFEASKLSELFTFGSRFWTLGGRLAQTVFDGGNRRGLLEEAIAGYESVAAAYRQTVLTAFQQVEDNLSALRYLAEEADKVQQAIAAAERQLKISDLQYRAGTASYLDVIIAQTAVLTAQQDAVNITGRRLVASVLLIQALGGGWTTLQIPTRREIIKK